MTPGLWRALANLAGFQLGWLACVLGGSLVGGIVAGGVIAAHLRWQARPGEWRWLAGFAGLGLVIDGGLAMAGGFRFPPETFLIGPLPAWTGPLPLWLWLLWPLFATLLHHSLAWLWRHPWLAAAGGATSGPLSYYAGAELAGVTLAPWLLAAEALCWAMLCLWLCHRLGRPGGLARAG
ncbi:MULTISPECIES: DUF2878 domain-containing protein [unclassified Halomonas]|uniref:DUF2878 domain-containing protein n=1 Tax=unclassified Halomonas TaxID=2609666 RepID=UPI00061486B9|nr:MULTISPECIES: DUF2878 family protein [unclassified Halomonas]RAH36884.1 DUF2878 domain-containing protein [Halomonas sp. SL1]